jgi:hypothetical protein
VKTIKVENKLENESAISFRWLKENLGLQEVSSRWQQVRADMRATTQIVSSTQDWMSDFWICKTADINPLGSGVVPNWNPPDELDEWPTVPTELLELYAPERSRPTNYGSFARLLGSATAVAESSNDAAISEFYALDDRAGMPQEKVALIQAQYVRAWLATAVGNLLSSIALSPQTYHAELVAESRRRLLIPRELRAAPMWGVQFAEGEIGILYNCRQSPSGNLSWGGIRIGQGEEWLKHWQWLSQAVDPAQIAPALPLAARLLRCRPLLEALLTALDSKDIGLEHIGLAVLRRWLLSLKAMAWLEDALARPWNQVRPQDLACLAFNAVKPDWPRRWVALSHRSMDAKPVLQTMKAWQSSLFAIDANYAPSWETNTGMIWGLFAATPILARIDSANYEASEWCERETEMIRYLEQTCDFMARRLVLDTNIEALAALDRMVDTWRPLSGVGAKLGQPEFPPWSMVYVPGPELEWPLALLRAAAALRVFHALYGGAQFVNRLCVHLSFSEDPVPIPPPTNNPEGWAAYRKIFRDFQRECGLDGGAPPLQLPPETSPLHPDLAQAFFDAIPDLSQGSPSLGDVLAALEWRATLLPLLEEASLGDMTLIDLRNLSRKTWETDPRLSLARGISALRAPPRPVWFIQLATQRVDDWGLPYDRPIFTQYSERQFAWMREGSPSPVWPAFYADRCGLVMSSELLQKCRNTKRID